MIDDEDISVRPKKLGEFVGQSFLVKQLDVMLSATKMRNEPLDHILLSGPPGLGKTTLANILANEMGGKIIISSGPMLNRPGLITILISMKHGDIFFIDEVHRLNKTLEEVLYPAMEDFYIDLIVGSGNNRSTQKFELNKFTLIGATTRSGLLEAPFRDRFGFTAKLELYSPDDLVKVLFRSSTIMGFPITTGGANEIAIRSRGTPRTANRLLRRVRDYAQVNSVKEIDRKICDITLSSLGIDKNGLDNTDRKILQIMIKDFGGSPVGLKNIAISLGEDVKTVEDVYEPFLIHTGLIKRTSRGREVTQKGLMYLKIENEYADNKITNIKGWGIGNVEKAEKVVKIASRIPLINDEDTKVAVKKKKYGNYDVAMLPFIPLLKKNISQSDDGMVSIKIKDLKNEMGKSFKNLDIIAFLYGVIYTLKQYDMYINNAGDIREDKDILIIRKIKK